MTDDRPSPPSAPPPMSDSARDLAWSRLSRASAGVLIMNGVSTGLILGLHVFLARLLGALHYGDYSYAFTWLTVLTVPAVFGMDTAALRFVAAYRSLAKWGSLRGFLNQSFRVASRVALLLSGAVALGALLGTTFMRAALVDVFFAAALALLINPLLFVTAAAIRGLHSPLLAGLPRLIVRPILLAATVGVIFLVSAETPTAVQAMLCEVAVTGATLALALLILRIKLPATARRASPEFDKQLWHSTAVPLMVLASLQLLLRHTDVLLLGYLHGTDVAGIYGAASRMAQLTTFGLMAINGVLPPVIAVFHARGESRKLQTLVTLAARTIFVFTLVVGVVLVLFRTSFLEIFGQPFVAANAAMAILIGGQIVNALSGTVAFLLTMTGHQATVVRILVATVAGNVLLNAVLIPRFGMEGGAVATAVATAGANLALVYATWKHLHIDPTAIGWKRHSAK